MCSDGGGNADVMISSSSSSPSPLDGADWDDREERAPGHCGLEVVDQQGRLDLLAVEVAVHQTFVLGLLDDALDEGAAAVVDEQLLVVARRPDRAGLRRSE